MISAFSSRRASITDKTQKLVDAFRRAFERDPTRRELRSLRQEANLATRKGKDGAAVDYEAMLADWQGKAEEAELGSLEEVGAVLWSATERDGHLVHELTAEGERQLGAIALAEVQARAATWSRADLVSELGQALPNGFVLAEPERAGEYLGQLADRVMSSGQVVRLDVGEFPTVPDVLRRADGTSVYVAPDSERYATISQLSMEDALISAASATGAPHLTRELAADLIGATVEDLDAQVADAPGDGGDKTASGLRLDQGAAAFHVITSERRCEVIVAAAGAGKTYTAAQLARMWKAAGFGRVIGLALSSKGRDVLAEAGVPECYNLAEYLGHTVEEREARGQIDPGEDALILVDEASMAGLADGEAVLRSAALANSKVIAIGDTEQLQAPEGSPVLPVLADRLGFVQLDEPVRFAPGWQREASLQLRAGDVRGLQAYDLRGRLHGGRFEAMAEQAAAMFIAEHLADRDAACTAATHREVGELNRRIQDHLDRLGLRSGRSVPVGEYRARAGDLVKALANDNKAGIGNGDVMVIDSINGGTAAVRRSLPSDSTTGQRIWSEPYQVSAGYLAEHADLGYATTTHTKQGDTVWAGIALVRDDRSRQSLYPAITRGRDANHVFAYPSDPDCYPGLEGAADPEVARSRKLAAEWAGGAELAEADEFDPVSLLAQVVARDATQLSATAVRELSQREADSVRTLFWQRQDITRADADKRFGAALRASLPAAQAEAALSDTDDLYRALRAAELAGLDGAEVLAEAAARRQLDTADSVSAALAWRVRQATEEGPTVHQSGPVRDQDLAPFAAGLDQLLADRAARIAEHAADTEADWATRAIGAVPTEDAERADWLERAAKVGRWRELTGRQHEADALGPRPDSTSPELRAEWDRAAEASPMIDGMDLRHLSEGQLLAQRQAFGRETAWAPPHTDHEMAVTAKAAGLYGARAARHDQLAEASARRAEPAMARAHARKAEENRAAQAKAADVFGILDGLHEARQAHDALVADTLRVGIAADREAHRRGLLPASDKLASQEPKAFEYESEPEADGQQSDKNARAMLGIGAESIGEPVPEHVHRLSAIASAVTGGLPVHIAARILGHHSLDTTQAYLAVFQADLIRSYRAFVSARRSARPAAEYREPTDEEWTEFQQHFELRKVELGTCGRPYGTPCAHEHACVRCPMLRVDPRQHRRLNEIIANLRDRISEARANGWGGEAQGLQVSLDAAQAKLASMVSAERNKAPGTPTDLGMPVLGASRQAT
jgi:AAA domain-containing protein